MTVTTPRGLIVLHDSIRDLSATRYLLFNQAWARENGLGTDIYDADSHLARLGMFMKADTLPALATEYNNLLLGLDALMAGEHLQAATLAPLVVSINGKVCADASESGLKATAAAILATGITQAALEEAVSESKKNFKRN